MDYEVQPMWKGGKMPDTFPHVCPYRLEGADRKSCLELSGANYHQNKKGCCGASRGSSYFEPCNSSMRRCIVCIQMGRRGSQANVVTNVATGTCDEHAAGIVSPKPVAYVPTAATRIALAPVRKRFRGDEVPSVRTLPDKLDTPREESPPVVENTVLRKSSAKRRKADYSPETHAATFRVLMELREQIRENGEPAPYKRQLAKAAAPLLGWQVRTTEVFIYQRLSKEETAALQFGLAPNTPPYTQHEQIEILKRVREEMEARGLPFVRIADLAKEAAPLLMKDVSGVKTLISGLPESIVTELKLGGSNSRLLAGHGADTIRQGFLGGIAVLKLQRMPLSLANLQRILRVQLHIVEKYLKEHPDIRALLVDEKQT